jgi:hypothetical protein
MINLRKVCLWLVVSPIWLLNQSVGLTQSKEADETQSKVPASVTPLFNQKNVGSEGGRNFLVTMTEPNQVVTCDLGKVWTLSELDLTFLIHNKRSKEFVAKEVTASCSCLGSIHRDLQIKPDSVGELYAQFQLPEKAGSFERSVTVIDAEATRLTVVIKGEAICPVKLLSTSFVVSAKDREEGRCTYELEIERDRNFSIDWENVNWRAVFVVGCDILTVNRKSDVPENKARIRISLDAKELPRNLTFSDMRISGQGAGGAIFETDCRVFFAFNSVTNPRRVILRRFEDEWRSTFILHSPGFLPPEVKQTNMQLKLFDTASRDDSSFVTVDAECLQIENGSYRFRLQARGDSIQSGSALQSFELRHDDYEWFRVGVVLNEE